MIYDSIKDGVSAARKWMTPVKVIINPLDAIEQNPVYQRLRANGHGIRWVDPTRQRAMEQQGWRRVIGKGQYWRREIYVYHRDQLLLMHKAP